MSMNFTGFSHIIDPSYNWCQK